MNVYRVYLNKYIKEKTVWKNLLKSGYNPLYTVQENGERYIVCEANSPLAVEGARRIELETDREIDWEDQWRLHGLNYKNGMLHLSVRGIPIQLQPGPGFGDLSHPTTRLTLRLMENLVKDRDVIDVGSGSGILTVAAKALGAASAYGVDVDPQVIQHAETNATLNKLNVDFSLAERFQIPNRSNLFILMNMISSEQAVAWNQYPALWTQATDLIVSGLLKEEEEHYLQTMLIKGWKPIQTLEEQGWLAIHLQKKR